VADTLTVFFHEAAIKDRALAEEARDNISRVLHYLVKGDDKKAEKKATPAKKKK